MTNCTRRGWGVSVTSRLLFTPGKDPVPIVQEAGWSPGPAWTGAENLAPTGIRSPYRPARSQLLYRLSYPGPRWSRSQRRSLGVRKFIAIRICKWSFGIRTNVLIITSAKLCSSYWHCHQNACLPFTEICTRSVQLISGAVIFNWDFQSNRSNYKLEGNIFINFWVSELCRDVTWSICKTLFHACSFVTNVAKKLVFCFLFS
jgi:hypothetical protein